MSARTPQPTTEQRDPVDVPGRTPTPVLDVADISVEYDGPRPTRAVRGVSLVLRRGELIGIAGESGCGKSTLANAITRMLKPPAVLTHGSVSVCDREGRVRDVLALHGDELRAFRWATLSVVFQSAMSALNPVTRVGKQFDDIFRAHRPELSRGARRERTGELLSMVGIDPDRVGAFAHELSGGMRQRVVIAMALALEPDIVIMDEPTTALDVVVQREILDEISALRERLGFSIVFITHDMSLLLEISDRLSIMYAGEVVEDAPTARLAERPAHPYTLGLIESFPDMVSERRELRGIPGTPPDLRDELIGCPFAPRCRFAFDPCHTDTPSLRPVGIASTDGRDWQVSCHLHDLRLRPEGPPAELAGSGA